VLPQVLADNNAVSSADDLRHGSCRQLSQQKTVMIATTYSRRSDLDRVWVFALPCCNDSLCCDRDTGGNHKLDTLELILAPKTVENPQPSGRRDRRQAQMSNSMGAVAGLASHAPFFTSHPTALPLSSTATTICPAFRYCMLPGTLFARCVPRATHFKTLGVYASMIP
jgi:hypothetical protein